MQCWHFRDGAETTECYRLIRMCDGKNCLKARDGHGSLTEGLRLKASPKPFSPKTLPHHHYAAPMNQDLPLAGPCSSHRQQRAFARVRKPSQLSSPEKIGMFSEFIILIIPQVFHHGLGNASPCNVNATSEFSGIRQRRYWRQVNCLSPSKLSGFL
jgi:hypothetical protein